MKYRLVQSILSTIQISVILKGIFMVKGSAWKYPNDD